jgi:hypothetical protein
MRSLFDELEDETPPSAGQEIGEAVSQAIEKVAETNERMVSMLAAAMQEALKRQEVEPVTKPEPPRQWRFDVHRDKEGRMTHVVATAS